MCDVNENELNEVKVTDEDEYLSEVEEQLEILGLNEELSRVELQHNPTSETSEDTKNSNFYKESIVTIETVGEAFQKLLGYGIDYQNSLVIATNLMTNDASLKQQI